MNATIIFGAVLAALTLWMCYMVLRLEPRGSGWWYFGAWGGIWMVVFWTYFFWLAWSR